jgi:hypothetical protein
MTTYRSTEPFTGIDVVLAKVLPFLAGTEPRIGEKGIDRQGREHEWTGAGWQPTGAQHEPEAGG